MGSWELAQVISRVPLLAALPPRESQLVAPLFRAKTFATREMVVREGTQGTALYVVLIGYLKATTLSPDGKETLLSVMGPDEVIGELSVLDGQPCSANVIALEPVTLATIDRAPLLQVLGESPQLSIRLIEVLAQRLRHVSRRCGDIASMNVCSRLAAALVSLAEKHGLSEDGGVCIPVKLSQQDLGNMVGATRESVNKLLRHWTESGLLRQEGGRMVIMNFEAMRMMAPESERAAP